MKTYLVLILGVFMLNTITAQEIKWMSMNEALEAQKESPKKIFMDAYTDWCGPCKLMDKKTFHNKDVAKYVNEHFYPVKFDAEGTEEIDYQGFKYTNPNYVEGQKGHNTQHFLAHALKIQGYPSIVFFDEESNVIAPVVGYKTPQQLELYLKMMVSDDYKKLTSDEAWKDYQENFTSTFAQ